jgi:uncharacterized membrane protein YhaH (DUF805 family)
VNEQLAEPSGWSTLLLPILLLALVLWAWSNVLRKAGYSPWWCMLALVPIVNLIGFVWFSRADWPALRKDRQSVE